MKLRLVLSPIIGLLFMCAQAQDVNQKVVEQKVKGNVHIPSETILLATQLKPGTLYTAEKARKDRDSIMNLGLFQGVLPHAETGASGVTVIYDIVENPFIQKINISGNSVVTKDEIIKVMQTKPGQVLNFNSLRGDVSALRELYAKKGFLYVDFPKFEPNSSDNSILELQILEARVAKINIVGNHRTKLRVIKNEIKTHEGQVYNQNTWQKDSYRVFNRGYFEDVNLQDPKEFNNDPGQLELTMVVKERHTGTLNVGFGYDQRQGLFGLFEVQDNNFRGMGQTVGLNLQRTADNKTSAEVSFSDPSIDNKHTGLGFRLYDRIVYRFSGSFFGSGVGSGDQRYDERHEGGEVSLNRPFGDINSGFLSLRTETISTNNVATLPGDQFIQQDGTTSSVSLGLVQNNRDIDFNPAKGHYYRGVVEVGESNVTNVGGVLGSTNLVGSHTFVKYSLDLRFYKSLQGPRTKPDQQKQVFAARFFAATVDGTIPFWEQFFEGGSESIRGYQEDRFWGRNAFLASFEYRRPLQKALSLVLFTDIGDAWGGYPSVNQFTQSSTFQLQLGYGIGIHFQTPLGPLSLEFALNKDGHARTHFRVGQTF